VQIIGTAIHDNVQRLVIKPSWDVEQFMNTPWALDPHSRWEVALTELTIPKTFQMYPDRLNPLAFVFSTEEEHLQEFIFSGNNFYQSPSDVVDYMNALVADGRRVPVVIDEEDEESVIMISIKDHIEFCYDPHTLRVLLKIKTPPPVDIILNLSRGLVELFNLAEGEYKIMSGDFDGQIERIVFSGMFKFNLMTDYIHILLQEANMSFINNKMAPWLYSCSIGSSNVVSQSHTHLTVKPKSLCYVPLNYVNSMRNKLHLSVVDNELNILKPQNHLYKHNKTVFHLHFRNILPGR